MRSRIIRLIAVTAVIAAVVFLGMRMDFRELRTAMSRAMLAPIAIAATLNFAILLCKAATWRVLLAPDHDVSNRRLVRYTVIAFASSIVLPLRAGELVRVWMLRDRDGVPVARSVAVAFAEKLLDVISMLALLACLLVIARDIPVTVRRALAVVAASVLVGLLVARVLVRGPSTGGWRGDVRRGLDVVQNGRKFAAGVGLLLVSWIVDPVMIELVLYSVGLDISATSGLLCLLGANVAVAIPSTPASVGALEVGVVLALRLAGISDATALSVAVLYHALQIVPLVLVGLALGLPDIVSYRRSELRP